MDSNILQLFTMEEILTRFSEKEVGGSLHVFNLKESANLFWRSGVIVGAAKGLLEGEEVVRQILDWKDCRCIWQPDLLASLPCTKEVAINVEEFLLGLKITPMIAIGGKTVSQDMPVLKPEFTAPSQAYAATPEVDTWEEEPAAPVEPRPPRPAGFESQPIHPPTPLTATKNMNTSAPTRITHEESLLQRFPLVLVPKGDIPGERMKLSQLSVLIGRNPACDFILDHPSVSRQHCLLQITERGLHVKDLGTTNGTKVNGIVLTEGYINVGDKLTIGHVMFMLDKEIPTFE